MSLMQTFIMLLCETVVRPRLPFCIQTPRPLQVIRIALLHNSQVQSQSLQWPHSPTCATLRAISTQSDNRDTSKGNPDQRSGDSEPS